MLYPICKHCGTDLTHFNFKKHVSGTLTTRPNLLKCCITQLFSCTIPVKNYPILPLLDITKPNETIS
ncbi:RNA polymerase, subunit 10 [Salmon gill poxvirus]|uniref:RNA polymerase, subunit 10 n=1 Tax=Salmon gill poxvirus TaxID=1680908 RepID=A0A0H4YFN7_9POXV|nr:RNA polymerase, subunit 10 [Salmon gill poxvirus]AKR04269.1 RNA polymerase, subunit 10 [Salmon gill poxvirus]